MSERVLEAFAAECADRGFLSHAKVEQACRIPDVDTVLSGLLASHWQRACSRGWEEKLARHALRKLPPACVAGLFGGGALDLRTALALLGWVMRLPALPGVSASPPAGNTKMVEKVRALLAKAESTEFPEEAEALTVKAQQLITEHCLEEALSSAATGDGPRVARMVADDPYAEAKSLLISVVAAANRCKAVWIEAFGFATVMGYAADLEAVELIYTSLLVQATRSMTMVGQSSAALRSRSFRRSFLVAFAVRIGERLKEAEGVARLAVADDRLLPVLAARDTRVEEVASELFPVVRSTRITTTNGYGLAAGRSAADQAELSPFERVGGL